MFLLGLNGKTGTRSKQKIPFNTKAESGFIKILKNAEKYIILLA